MSVRDLSRGTLNTGQQPLPRAALTDDEPSSLEGKPGEDDELPEDALPALLATRPKSRSECCPTPDTVICPVESCRAAIGLQCVGRAAGAFHQERKELARAHLRPCPWVSCPHHKYLYVAPNGSIIFNYPDQKPWELERSCELDDIEATGGEITLEELGEDFSLTRERMRQIEAKGIAELRENASHLSEEESFSDLARRLDAEALARRTVFSPTPPRRLGSVGNCPDCKTQRYKENGKWRCRCRRRRADSE